MVEIAEGLSKNSSNERKHCLTSMVSEHKSSRVGFRLRPATAKQIKVKNHLKSARRTVTSHNRSRNF